MDTKKIALLIGALLIAGVTAFMAKNMFDGASAPKANAAVMPAQTGPKILVAQRALPVGTILGPDAFKYQPWPADMVENAYFKQGDSDPSTMTGMVVRTAITAGQPLTQGALVKPGERGFLAAALGAGMRAVTVKTSKLAGVAGFIFPGDRVDLLLTQTVRDKFEGGKPLNVSETILGNVRVLATDQRTETTDEQGKQVVKVYTSVTLEVTPKMAEKIVVAQSMGALTLSLRSLADNSTDLEQAIAAGSVSMGNAKDPKAEKTMMAQVAARPFEGSSTFSTGGDVSRFGRRSVPRATPPIPATVISAAQARASADRGELERIRRSNSNGGSAPRIIVTPPADTVKVYKPGGSQVTTFGGN
jgi:pilus assembly protein CpaB